MRLETDDLAGHREVATHTTTTGPSSPVISAFLSILINPQFPQCNSQLFGKEKIESAYACSFHKFDREMAVVSYITIGSTRFSLLSCCTTARKMEGKMTNTGTDADMAFIKRDFSN